MTVPLFYYVDSCMYRGSLGMKCLVGGHIRKQRTVPPTPNSILNLTDGV